MMDLAEINKELVRGGYKNDLLGEMLHERSMRRIYLRDFEITLLECLYIYSFNNKLLEFKELK